MKKVAFVVSHLGSNSDYLVKILNNNPRCTILSSNHQYNNVESLEFLYKFHKYRSSSGSVYGDHLLYNQSFSCKLFYNICKFIYVIRSPRQSLNEICFNHRNYSKQSAISYYRFRLRRIYEMAKQTKNSVLITYDELMDGKSFEVIQNYLGLIEPLKHDKIDGEDDRKPNEFEESLLLKTEDCFEKYYYHLNNLEIIRP
jgi:hypothetical protein